MEQPMIVEFFQRYGDRCTECRRMFGFSGGQRPFVDPFCGHAKCRRCITESGTRAVECIQCSKDLVSDEDRSMEVEDLPDSILAIHSEAFPDATENKSPQISVIRHSFNQHSPSSSSSRSQTKQGVEQIIYSKLTRRNPEPVNTVVTTVPFELNGITEVIIDAFNPESTTTTTSSEIPPTKNTQISHELVPDSDSSAKHSKSSNNTMPSKLPNANYSTNLVSVSQANAETKEQRNTSHLASTRPSSTSPLGLESTTTCSKIEITDQSIPTSTNDSESGNRRRSARLIVSDSKNKPSPPPTSQNSILHDALLVKPRQPKKLNFLYKENGSEERKPREIEINSSALLVSRTTFKPSQSTSNSSTTNFLQPKIEPGLEEHVLNNSGPEVKYEIASTPMSIAVEPLQAKYKPNPSVTVQLVVGNSQSAIASTSGVNNIARNLRKRKRDDVELLLSLADDSSEDERDSEGSDTGVLNSGTSSDSKKEAKTRVRRNKSVVIPSHITILPDGYRCEICLKEFKTKAHVKYHEFCGKECNDKPFHCDLCGGSFIAKSHFLYHMRTHTGERPFTCEACGKSFNAGGKLSRHMKIHSGEKPFPCTSCAKAFCTNQALKAHRLIHSGERPFKCLQCPQRFNNQTNLRKHSIVHTGERPFECDVCHKSFGLKWYLDVHKKIHSSERPHACDICSKAFSNRKDLRRHKTIHSDVRPFKCSDCNATFRRKDNLDRHQRHLHLMELIRQSSANVEVDDVDGDVPLSMLNAEINT